MRENQESAHEFQIFAAFSIFNEYIAKELLATNFLLYFLHEAVGNGDYWLTETYKLKLSDRYSKSNKRQIHKKFNNFVKIFFC